MSSKTKEKNPATPAKRYKVYVVGGGYEYLRMLFNLGYDGAKGLDDADIVLFTGGADVNPEMYGEVCMHKTNFDRLRDQREHIIYQGALDRGLPMVGICRGGQFLNVENDGKLWQHVTQHTNSHLMRIELPPFNKGDKRRTIEVTSTHHQMMIPTPDAIIIGTANEAIERIGPTISKIGKGGEEEPDIEVVFYEDTNCLCFQPHPEIATAKPELIDFFEECMTDWIIPMVPTGMEKVILEQARRSVTKGL
jgi:gamma-glutamyl-gamma-aminobutyrate hydrolase PuuD